MNLIELAKEQLAIFKANQYMVDDKIVKIENYDPALIAPEKAIDLASLLISNGKIFNGDISIKNETTIKAASDLDNPVILNFASATEPGGGFLRGAKAQEEDICRKTTLFRSLEKAKSFYHLGMGSDYLYSDAMVFSHAEIIRDESFSLLEKPKKIGVITCAAPNKFWAEYKENKGKPSFIFDKDICSKFFLRISAILALAEIEGYKDIVLGAWGCGAFGNDPELVSHIFKSQIQFSNLKKVVFAIPSGSNLDVFKKTFNIIN